MLSEIKRGKDLRQLLQKAYLYANHDFPFAHRKDEGAQFKTFVVLQRLVESGILPNARLLSIGAGAHLREGVLAFLGYEVTTLDDLKDLWHIIGQNRSRIRKYAQAHDICLLEYKCPPPPDLLPEAHFQAVLVLDLIEHLHDSPRDFLNYCISRLIPGGVLIITTPNAAHAGKRLKVLLGRSPYGPISRVYWNVGPYRGHHREYARSELEWVLETAGLQQVQVDTANILAKSRKSSSRLLLEMGLIIHELMSAIIPSLRDTLIGSGVRPSKWEPVLPTGEMLRASNPLVGQKNLDDLSDVELINSVSIQRSDDNDPISR